jgi:predicted GIY-YIG superfamily endonuclease
MIRHRSCHTSRIGAKRFVYVIRNEKRPDRRDTGLTSDVSRRLTLHNTAMSGQTLANRPWRLVVAIECADETTARRFERYLKSGSGRAFAKRHFGAP